MRSYSGTLRPPGVRRTAAPDDPQCLVVPTSLFWFNTVDGRGPLSLRDSIADHMALMRWHGVSEGSLSRGTSPTTGSFAMATMPSLVLLPISMRMWQRAWGVTDYICQYMFETSTSPIESHGPRQDAR